MRLSDGATTGLPATRSRARAVLKKKSEAASPRRAGLEDAITLFLGGDVMTGRGIDQVLPHPGNPRVCERRTSSATTYIELAEKTNGPIPRPVDFAYVWGAALEALDRARPDVRVINLETSVTTSEDRAPKGINYRMNPANIRCLTAAGIDCCGLANNHVLDWGHEGLKETLRTLGEVEVGTAGAGADLEAAEAPAIIEVAGRGRVLVFAFGTTTSGIPRHWAASADRAGVALLEDLSVRTLDRVAARVRAARKPRDVVVASIHWGDNWGYHIGRDQRAFGRGLIEAAGVDVVHGHSSHHAKGIEIHEGKPILYGCGDLLNDYEGIGGYPKYRSDLALIYLLTIVPSSGELVALDMTPLRIRNFRLNRTSAEESRWLRDILNREGKRFGTRVEPGKNQTLSLRWDE